MLDEGTLSPSIDGPDEDAPPAQVRSNPPTPEVAGHPWRMILLCWAFAATVLLLTCAQAIIAKRFPDPDDVLRLLEARDFVAGQSWWDVSQHRLASGMMHWSRLVDLPIAAVIIATRPIFGAMLAEHIALVAVPLLTLLVVMALLAFITRRLLDDERATLALLITPLTVPLIYQLRPMRIDHHGWQIALALAATLAFPDRRSGWRAGAIGGVAIGLLLTISLEGLPIAAALLGLVALDWVINPAGRNRLLGAAWGAALSAILLHLTTRGPYFFAPACDAMAPVWLAILTTAAIGTTLSVTLARRTPWLRLAALGVTGLLCVGALFAVDPRCTSGPFQMLDPLVRTLWYDEVSEGLPIWQQLPIWAVMSIGLPIVGIAGSALALRGASAERRAAWWFLLSALVAATALSILVSRAGATANALAVPGAAYVLAALLTRARRIDSIVPRILATAAALLVAAPGVLAIAIFGFPEDAVIKQAVERGRIAGVPQCERADDSRALAQLPPSVLFAPIDIAPELIGTTDHHAITSGHHRNAVAMGDVLRTFIGSPDQARAIVTRYHADYVVGCPGLNETELYRRVAPNGFWARLQRGERFDWLQPVAIRHSPVLAWRVINPSQTAERLLP